MYMVVLILVLALACHTITRLITRDRVPFGALRERFVKRWGTYDEPPPGIDFDPKESINGKRTNPLMRLIAYGIECDWCVSVWISGILVLATEHWLSVPLPWLVWPAVRTVSCLIAEREEM